MLMDFFEKSSRSSRTGTSSSHTHSKRKRICTNTVDKKRSRTSKGRALCTIASLEYKRLQACEGDLYQLAAKANQINANTTATEADDVAMGQLDADDAARKRYKPHDSVIKFMLNNRSMKCYPYELSLIHI